MSKLYHVIISLLWCVTCAGGEGFVKGTLIKTMSGYIPIEEISVNSPIMCCNENGETVESVVVATNIMSAENSVIVTSEYAVMKMDFDQKVWVVSKKLWVKAKDLCEWDVIVSLKCGCEKITSVMCSQQKETLYSLSVKEYQNFFVTEQDILVHNVAFIAAVPAAAATIVAAAKALTAVTVFAGCAYSLLWAKSAAHAAGGSSQISSNNDGLCWCGCSCAGECGCYCYCVCGQRNRSKKTENEHPNGIYKEDARYHHKNSNGTSKSGKSPSPKNGQQALNNSIKDPGNSARRIGVSEGQIVVLSQTSSGVFHGHVISWEVLRSTDYLRMALNEMIKEGLISKKGEILR